MSLTAVSRKVANLPEEDRQLVEEGLKSVVELMAESSPRRVATAVLQLKTQTPISADTRAARETRNLLRVFADWQVVRDESVTGAQLVKLGVTRHALEQRRRSRKLLALRVPFLREFVYPVWQFDDDGRPYEAMPALLKAATASRLSPTDVHFLMRHEDAKGRTLAGRLREGAIEDVLRAIRSAGSLGG